MYIYLQLFIIVTSVLCHFPESSWSRRPYDKFSSCCCSPAFIIRKYYFHPAQLRVHTTVIGNSRRLVIKSMTWYTAFEKYDTSKSTNHGSGVTQPVHAEGKASLPSGLSWWINKVQRVTSWRPCTEFPSTVLTLFVGRKDGHLAC